MNKEKRHKILGIEKYNEKMDKGVRDLAAHTVMISVLTINSAMLFSNAFATGHPAYYVVGAVVGALDLSGLLTYPDEIQKVKTALSERKKFIDENKREGRNR